MNNSIKYSIAFIAFIVLGLSLYNASWIADEPKGKIKLVGHGKWPLPVDSNDCIIDAQLALNEKAYNADVRSLRTIGAYDADGINFETELEGGKLVIPRPPATNCLSDLERPRSGIVPAIEAMSALDIYMPLRSGDDIKADALVQALKGKTFPNQVWVYGNDILTKKVAAALPNVKALPIAAARQCITDYKSSGWYGNIPDSCAQGQAIITLDDGFALWGWPNRLMARFAENDIAILIVKDIKEGELLGLTKVDSYGDIPETFTGTIWVEDIKNLGPALIR